MKRFVLVCLLLSTFYAIDAQATNWYVRSGAGGTGTSWTNAWSDVTNISWGSTAPGDTIWLAGGSYGVLVVGKSGNADNNAGRIFIKRATIASHGAEAGWSAAYDAQVLLGGVHWITLNLGGYVTIDGQVGSGIRIDVLSGTGAAMKFDRGAPYITIRNVELVGPCGEASCTQGGDNRGIDITAFNGSSYDLVDHFKIQHSKIHGFCTLMILFNADNAVVEYNDFYDNSATDFVICHPNFLYTSGSENFTLRNNLIHNYSTEGIIMSSGSGVSGAWYIYGNLWYQGGASSGPFARVVETRVGENGPVYFFNNTVVGVWATWNGAGGTWHPDSTSRNNIYWDCNGSAAPNSSYDFCSGTCGGPNSISNGSNPFVDVSGGDFHIVSKVGATYPKDKGINLGSPYHVDIDRATRGTDGTWDIGAYEYTFEKKVSPAPPGNIRIQ